MNSIKLSSKISKCQYNGNMKGIAGGIKEKVQACYARMKILKRRTIIAGFLGSGAGQAMMKESRGLEMWATIQEDNYFYNKQKQQLLNIKRQLEDKNELEAQKKQDKDSGMNFMKFIVKDLKIFRRQDCINAGGIAGGMKILNRSISKAGIPGSGAGRGGGAGGAVKESGGGLGLWAAANEESYFFKKQKKQLEDIKRQLEEDKKSQPADEKK